MCLTHVASAEAHVRGDAAERTWRHYHQNASAEPLAIPTAATAPGASRWNAIGIW